MHKTHFRRAGDPSLVNHGCDLTIENPTIEQLQRDVTPVNECCGSTDPATALTIAVTHPKDFTGVLHADGYAGCNWLYEGHCIAEVALDRIGALYAVATTINGMTPEQRRRQRQAQSKPIAEHNLSDTQG